LPTKPSSTGRFICSIAGVTRDCVLVNGLNAFFVGERRQVSASRRSRPTGHSQKKVLAPVDHRPKGIEMSRHLHGDGDEVDVGRSISKCTYQGISSRPRT
jgi:hypothetical protein